MTLDDTGWRRAIYGAVAGNRERLADLLRSDEPMNADDRDLLADYVMGIAAPPGKRSTVASVDQRRAAIKYVVLTDGVAGASESILAELVKRTGKDRSTVLGWVEEQRDLEARMHEMWRGLGLDDDEMERRLSSFRADMLRS